MQVLTKRGGSFRIIAILEEVFDFDACECWETNEEFARAGGHCTTKTVSRELSALKGFGLITAEPGWIEKAGKMTKGRRIRLSVPSDLSGIHVR